MLEDDDYPIGRSPRALDRMQTGIRAGWGGPLGIDRFAPSLAEDQRSREWWARLLRSASSPRGAAQLIELYREIDTRPVLGSIQAPTLVLHRKDDRLIRSCWGRYLAERIPGARFVELPGADHLPIGERQTELLGEIEEFLTGSRHEPDSDRVLASVLFGDIVGSTERALALGDRRWKDLLAEHDAAVHRQLHEHRGRLVKTLGDGFLATFDGPARAIRSAVAARSQAAALGLELRLGVHTGEIEQLGEDVGGIAVHIGARVAAAAEPGEVLVSGTVKDLVAGSRIRFADRGSHELKGLPGEWQLYAVEQ